MITLSNGSCNQIYTDWPSPNNLYNKRVCPTKNEPQQGILSPL
jgi:hypothetical protein